jgi:hypothetical protein
MDITVEQINRYKIVIGGIEYDDFEKESEWNGMISFKSPSHGVVIVHKKETTENLFANIFGEEKPSDVITFQVAKMSPKLIPTKKDKEGE